MSSLPNDFKISSSPRPAFGVESTTQDPAFEVTREGSPEIKLTKQADSTSGLNKITSFKGQNNFISRLKEEYGADFDNYTRSIQDVHASIEKSDKGYKFETLKFPDDYPAGAKQPSRPNLKVKIIWKIQTSNGDKTIEQYFDTGVKLPKNLKNAEEVSNSQQAAILSTKAYIQLMKAPLDPRHAKYDMARSLINQVALGEIGAKTPYAKSIDYHAITHLRIWRQDNTSFEFGYDLTEDARGGNVSRLEKLKATTSGSVVSNEKGEMVNKVVADTEKTFTEVRKKDNLVNYCQTNNISMEKMRSMLAVRVEHDKQKYNRLVDFFKTEGYIENPAYRAKPSDSNKPDFNKMMRVYSGLAEQNKKLKTDIETLTQQFSAINGEDADSLSRKKTLTETLNTKTESLSKFDHYIEQFEVSLVQLKAVQESWKEDAKLLLQIEQHIALQFATAIKDKIPIKLQNQLTVVMDKLIAREDMTTPDNAPLYHDLFVKILYPNSGLIHSIPSIFGDMTTAQAYKTMVLTHDMRIYLVERTESNKASTLEKIEQKAGEIRGKWGERNKPLRNITVREDENEYEGIGINFEEEEEEV